MTALGQSKISVQTTCITYSYANYPSGREGGPKKCKDGLTERKITKTLDQIETQVEVFKINKSCLMELPLTSKTNGH